MSIFSFKVVDAYESAYKTAYSPNKKKYTSPKIYHGGENFDLSKRWYVYYSFINPKTSKLTRQTPLYLDVNKAKSKQERLRRLYILRDEVERLLEEGYSPYDKVEEIGYVKKESVKESLDFALELKSKSVSQKTYRDYVDKARVFVSFLTEKSLSNTHIRDITKGHVVEFLNRKLQETTSTTRNSYRRTLSALFSVLADNEYIERNFVSSIPVMPSQPTMNKAYSQQEANMVIDYLKQNDFTFYLLVQFVSYNFLRPVEVCRLQVRDIDLKQRMLTVRTKTKACKVKRIPDIMAEELKQLDLSDKEAFLITANGIARTSFSAESRRHLFTKRFQKIRPLLGLSEKCTIYSFRHTFITKLYRKLRIDHRKNETYDILMPITGHSTITALEKYLRDIDAEIAEDYSHLFK